MRLHKTFVTLLIMTLCTISYNFGATDGVVDSELTFETANNLYKKNNFKKAMELYQKIPNKSAYTNYNLGNCAYKLGKNGQALLYWRRAERDWGLFGRSELIENITLLKENVKSTTGMTTNSGPVIMAVAKLKNFTVSLLRWMPLLLIQMLFLLLWLFLFIYIRFLYKKKKKWTITTLFAAIALFGILLVVRYSLDARRNGVVVNEQQTRLLSGPGEAFQVLMQLEPAQEVLIQKETSGYYKVKALKRIGWVSRKDVEKI